MTTITQVPINQPARTSDQTEPDAHPTHRSRRARFARVGKFFGIGLAILVVLLTATVVYSSRGTEAVIADHHERIAALGTKTPSQVYDLTAVTELPQPVQRYFDYTFQGEQEALSAVTIKMDGDFRRPRTEGFEFTTAEQTIAVGTPALMFSARTTLFPGIWARVYDVYSNGEMEMKAKVMSTLTVVDERESPELNEISLRRWLLESPMYPAALLPGGPVTWEAVDASHARATVSADGLEASLLATFNADGSLASFEAEEDGDLNTPYHGSGEHVVRGDYRLVSGTMIPHSFTISRAADGEIYPFWSGRVIAIGFQAAG